MKITRKVLDEQLQELNNNKALMKVLSMYYTKKSDKPCYLALGHNYMGYYLMVYTCEDAHAQTTIASALTAITMHKVLGLMAIFDNWLNYAIPTLK